MKLKQPATPKQSVVVAKPVAVNPTAAKPIVAKLVAPARTQAPAKVQHRATVNLNNALPPGEYWANAGSTTYSMPKQKTKKSKQAMWIALAALAGVFVLGLGITGLIFVLPSGKPTAETIDPARNIQANANDSATEGRQSSAYETSKGTARFEDLKPELAKEFTPKIKLYRTTIRRDDRELMFLNVFVPSGQHAKKSLPVMLEAPAGTNLLHGAQVEYPRPQTEFLPFTDEGMITVSFSLDGSMPQGIDPDSGPVYWNLLSTAYQKFVASDAGIANGRLAIDFVLEKIPEADPQRLYVWGHSSAATLSLLLAANDSRISKCIALAPITDLNARLGELLTEDALQQVLPDLRGYFRDGSPITFVDQLKCPVYVAHARDDDNEPFQFTQAFVDRFRKAGGNVTFQDLSSGGHYQGLLDASIPKAIAWLK